ncbi:MAG: hypothetical protein AAF694_28650, partial [Bacteroidota bacterium]
YLYHDVQLITKVKLLAFPGREFSFGVKTRKDAEFFGLTLKTPEPTTLPPRTLFDAENTEIEGLSMC